jgi:hypothetical protein
MKRRFLGLYNKYTIGLYNKYTNFIMLAMLPNQESVLYLSIIVTSLPTFGLTRRLSMSGRAEWPTTSMDILALVISPSDISA